MSMAGQKHECDHLLYQRIKTLNTSILRQRPDIELNELERAYKKSINHDSHHHQEPHASNDTFFGLRFEGTTQMLVYSVLFCIFLFLATPVIAYVIEQLLQTRCFVPNNYIIWEATRPISDCSFCRGVNAPIILPNVTKEEFQPYAYSSRPIIIKRAVADWPAVQLLNFSFLKDLYESIPGAVDYVQEDCQFLHFKSNFMTLHDVFRMPDSRVRNADGQPPWYVGWSNCHPVVLRELRKLYPRPHFLPDDAEMPNTDFVFLGYEQGAIMHIDYIPRLMWQAQLRGNKSWIVAPTPECDSVCSGFRFYVEPGDALLIDTRIWYHETHIAKGEFSITIQSEYG